MSFVPSIQQQMEDSQAFIAESQEIISQLQAQLTKVQAGIAEIEAIRWSVEQDCTDLNNLKIEDSDWLGKKRTQADNFVVDALHNLGEYDLLLWELESELKNQEDVLEEELGNNYRLFSNAG